MKVIKNGHEKTFYAVCSACGTELEYDCSDICTIKSEYMPVQTKMISCPVCKGSILVTLCTKEEYEKMRFPYFGFGGKN